MNFFKKNNLLSNPVPVTEQLWDNDSIPLVSVCCITYNHSNFIKECIEGFLIQKTNFQIEVIIHDDASTDDTVDVIKYYCQKYPKIIKPIFQTENQYSQGISPMINFVWPQVRGQYIALCEGDDYWIYSSKLQNQFDFLNNNISYVAVADNSIVENSYNNKSYMFSVRDSRDILINEMLYSRQFSTASLLFRTSAIKELMSREIRCWDTFLFCYLASQGKIRYNNKVSSIYRRGLQGVTSSSCFSNINNLLNMNQLLMDKFSPCFISKNFCLSVRYYIIWNFLIKSLLNCNFIEMFTIFKKFYPFNCIIFIGSFINFVHKKIINAIHKKFNVWTC